MKLEGGGTRCCHLVEKSYATEKLIVKGVDDLILTLTLTLTLTLVPQLSYQNITDFFCHLILAERNLEFRYLLMWCVFLRGGLLYL